MRFQGQKILVIGGTSGIGLAIAQVAASEGAHVIIAGRTQERVTAAQSKVIGSCEGTTIDIGDELSVVEAFKRIGKLDHIVTTAAALTYGPLAQLLRSSIDSMIASKFLGPILVARHGAANIEPSGSILFLSKLAASKPGAGTAVVAAVNAGIEGLGRALAVELAPIRVNVLSPGVTDTNGWSFIPEQDRPATFAGIAASLPVKRIGKPADIAQAAIMLLLNEFTTGTVHHVDGGGRLS
jgi:NAD(P)-dependent dehydrogenase (short-subunit alcohol dehydrogenase family)